MYEDMRPEKRNLAIETILRAEWDMFRKVGNIGGRASCQEDWPTFRIMRYSYYNAWSDEMIRSYAKDLEEAVRSRRNLVTEKYAYMMAYTDPEYYKTELEPYLPGIDGETMDMIDEIAAFTVSCEKEFAVQYPKLAGKGRPVSAAGDSADGTSAEIYSKGELRTYSKKTLELFSGYVRKCMAEHVNFSCLVKDKMVKMYGYASLEDAESKM